MKKLLYLTLLLTLGQAFAQKKKIWIAIAEETIKNSRQPIREMSCKPSKKQLFTLDLEELKKALSQAPLDQKNINSNVIISFPDGNGKLKNYQVWDSPVMEEKLSAQFPELKSYVAYAVNDASDKMRFSLSAQGFSAYNINQNGAYAIEAYTNDNKVYAQYKQGDVDDKIPFECFTKPETKKNKSNNTAGQARANDGLYHTMRLVIACTAEYSNYHLNRLAIPANATDAQKRTAIMGVVQASVSAINLLYEKDLAVHFNLIADNAKAIFFDPLIFNNSSDDDKALGSERINTALAAGNPNLDANTLYDIGHVFSKTNGASGLAYTSYCSNNRKADATSGSNTPFGPAFDIDFVAHEIGHQLGADHTLSYKPCNSVAGYQFEPGSGTTIMGYAGLCGTLNIALNSDPFFHTKSISQIQEHITDWIPCKVSINNNNAAPIVNAGNNYTIPYSTAFVLNGSANDANTPAANLSYSWEQVDAAPNDERPFSKQTTGAIYRFRIPKTNDSKRYFPQFSDVLAGNLTPTWEVTPSVARTLNFILTVRDNNVINGGQTGIGSMSVNVANTGPFSIGSQASTGITYDGGSQQNISWNVAGTTANGINTANVKISLSTDGGANFSTILSASTPNNGSFTATMPNISAANCRIMIEAVGNVFYAINSKAFALKQSLSTQEFEKSSFSLSPNPTTNGQFTIHYNSVSKEAITIDITDALGQHIYHKLYQNTGELKEQFNLNLSKGLYMVNIYDNGNVLSKKIIAK
jgi:Metallo-peptidase family M12B Reprolysin-like/Secretion system C-terminal sorting domain